MIVRRGIAFVIDWNISFVFLELYMKYINELSDNDPVFPLYKKVLLFFLGFAVPGMILLIRDIIFRNASLGKLITGIKTVDISGEKATVWQVLLRNQPFIFPFFAVVEIVMTFVLPDHRRLGDRLAKTKVVKRRN